MNRWWSLFIMLGALPACGTVREHRTIAPPVATGVQLDSGEEEPKGHPEAVTRPFVLKIQGLQAMSAIAATDSPHEAYFGGIREGRAVIERWNVQNGRRVSSSTLVLPDSTEVERVGIAVGDRHVAVVATPRKATAGRTFAVSILDLRLGKQTTFVSEPGEFVSSEDAKGQRVVVGGSTDTSNFAMLLRLEDGTRISKKSWASKRAYAPVDVAFVDSSVLVGRWIEQVWTLSSHGENLQEERPSVFGYQVLDNNGLSSDVRTLVPTDVGFFLMLPSKRSNHLERSERWLAEMRQVGGTWRMRRRRECVDGADVAVLASANLVLTDRGETYCWPSSPPTQQPLHFPGCCPPRISRGYHRNRIPIFVGGTPTLVAVSETDTYVSSFSTESCEVLPESEAASDVEVWTYNGPGGWFLGEWSAPPAAVK